MSFPRSTLAAAVIAMSAFASCGSSPPEEMLSVELVPDVVTLHEPVFVEIGLQNESTQRVEADLGIARIGEFAFRIVAVSGGAVSKLFQPVGPTIFHTGGDIVLQPGERYSARHLLNEWFTIDSPGKYLVNVRFTGTVIAEEPGELPVPREFSLPLKVLARDPERLQALGRTLLASACQSRDLGAALNAAKTLSHLEDAAMTPFLAAMLECSYLVQVEAIAALARQDTTEALDALIRAARGSDIALAELARNALRWQISRRSPQLEPDLRQRIEEALPN